MLPMNGVEGFGYRILVGVITSTADKNPHKTPQVLSFPCSLKFVIGGPCCAYALRASPETGSPLAQRAAEWIGAHPSVSSPQMEIRAHLDLLTRHGPTDAVEQDKCSVSVGTKECNCQMAYQNCIPAMQIFGGFF